MISESLLAQFRDDLVRIYESFTECLDRGTACTGNIEIEKAVMAAANAIADLDQLVQTIEKQEGVEMAFFSRKKKDIAVSAEVFQQNLALAKDLEKAHAALKEIIRFIDETDWYVRREAALKVRAIAEAAQGEAKSGRPAGDDRV